MTRPSASAIAVSTDWVRRVRTSSFITSRSTTTSIVCLNFLSSAGGSSSRYCSPSTLTRVKPSLRELLEELAVLALAVAHHRRVDRETRSLGQREHLLDDRVDRLPGDRPPADGAVRPTDARVEQAQVVVDLGHGAHGRARVARGRLLVDRDRRAEALDRVDVGLLHHLEELARVGRERLDVAALALGVDRVEGKARLAGAGEPGDADERVPREPDRDVLEVVLPGAVDDQLVGCHGCAILPGERTFVRSTVLLCAKPVGEADPAPSAPRLHDERSAPAPHPRPGGEASRRPRG